MKFSLGQVVITPTVGEVLRKVGITPHELLSRHQAGDWGNISEEARRLNEAGLTKPLNLISMYDLPTGEVITVFTKADRSVTMLHIGPSHRVTESAPGKTKE